jgi:hypothetical protein
VRNSKPTPSRSTGRNAEVQADDNMLDRIGKGSRARGDSVVEKMFVALRDDIDQTPTRKASS